MWLDLRDWSLITGRGGFKTGGGGSEVFTPMKRGDGKFYSHAEGGGAETFLVQFFLRKLEVLAILKGGAKSFQPFKGGSQKSFTLP